MKGYSKQTKQIAEVIRRMFYIEADEKKILMEKVEEILTGKKAVIKKVAKKRNIVMGR